MGDTTVGQRSKQEWLNCVNKNSHSVKDRKVQVTARLTRSQFKRVKELERKEGISKAEAIRQLMEVE